jgi:anti-sigma factor RsiW
MMRPCEDIQPKIAAYSYGELSQLECEEIALHLSECPPCQREAASYAHLRQGFKTLKATTHALAPSPKAWENAVRAWKQHDASRRRRLELRMALVGACILLLAFGVSWARLFTNVAFPTEEALNDFRALQNPLPEPEFPTEDPDRAAEWLRNALHTEVSPINLSLSQAQLLGADTLPRTKPTLGRLLYRNAQGVIAVYIAPNRMRFPSLTAQTYGGRNFFVKTPQKALSLFGWGEGTTGYSLIAPRSAPETAPLAADAQRASALP